MQLIRKSIKSKKGQSIVEFALILPILLLLIFGIIEFGRVFNAYLIVTNAAREGAREAAVGRSYDDVESIINEITSNLGEIEIVIDKNETVRSVEVTVKHALKLITPIVGNLISEDNILNIKASTKMRIE